MNRPPRKIDEPFFGLSKIMFSCLQGVGILLITLAIYGGGLYLGFTEKEVRTMTFITLIVSNIAIILTNRSFTRNIFEILATPNQAVIWVLSGAIFFLGVILNVPFCLNLLRFERLHFINILICILAGLSTIAWIEIYKIVNQKKPFIKKIG